MDDVALGEGLAPLTFDLVKSPERLSMQGRIRRFDFLALPTQ